MGALRHVEIVALSCIVTPSQWRVNELLLWNCHLELIERGNQFQRIIGCKEFQNTVSRVSKPPPLPQRDCCTTFVKKLSALPNKIDGWNSSISWHPCVVCLPCQQKPALTWVSRLLLLCQRSARHLVNWKVIAPRVNALQMISLLPRVHSIKMLQGRWEISIAESTICEEMCSTVFV